MDLEGVRQVERGGEEVELWSLHWWGGFIMTILCQAGLSAPPVKSFKIDFFDIKADVVYFTCVWVLAHFKYWSNS